MLYMMLSSFVTAIIPTSCKAVMSSMQSCYEFHIGVCCLTFFIFFNSCSTSSAKIGEPSIPLFMGGAGHLSSLYTSSMYFDHLFRFHFYPSGFVHPKISNILF